MYVAEDVRNTLTIKAHGPMRACFVQSEIEAFSVEQRKDVMKERVEVGEIDTGSGRNDKQVWRKHLVFLHKTIASSRERNGMRGGRVVDSRKPQDNAAQSRSQNRFVCRGMRLRCHGELRGHIHALGQ